MANPCRSPILRSPLIRPRETATLTLTLSRGTLSSFCLAPSPPANNYTAFVWCSSGGGGDGDDDVVGDPATSEAEKQRQGRRRRARARQQRRERKDLVRAAILRRFLGEQAAAGEAKLCLGHAACRAESKDLSRRAAALISLLQVRPQCSMYCCSPASDGVHVRVHHALCVREMKRCNQAVCGM